LFDSNGYVVIQSQAEYRNNPHLQIQQDLHVPDGISQMPGYVQISDSGRLLDLSTQIQEVVQHRQPGRPATPQPTIAQPIELLAVPQDHEIDEETARALTQVYRILRDTKVARWVKFMHEYRCQLCDRTIHLPDSLYAEAHHIRPLGGRHRGPDVVENVMCLCPNHHVELDYGAIPLERDRIRAVSGHELSTESIEYHNTVIYRRRSPRSR
jgi:predicted restriction endonuclease